MRFVLVSLLAFCMAATAATGKADESPEAVLLAFYEDMIEEGPQIVVPRFTHPDDLVRLRRMLLPRIRQSFDVAGDDFVRRIFGKEIPLKDIEALSPAEFMSAFLWNNRLDGSDFKPPRVVRVGRDGDFADLEVRMEVTSLEGNPIERHEVVRFKAMGKTWRLTLDPRLEAYVAVLLDS